MKKQIGIIGAGHNSMVAACYLAEAGHDVTLFEASDRCGGLCVNESIFPGVVGPSVASFAGMLRPEIIQHLGLDEWGVEWFCPDEPGLYLFPDGRALSMSSDHWPDWISAKDRQALERLERESEQMAAHLDALLLKGVMSQREMIDHACALGLHDWAAAMFDGTWHDFLKTRFDNPYLIAALSTNTSLLPDMPGSVFSYLFLCCAHINEQPFSWGRCVGGMGRISEALEHACRQRGVTIECSNPVLSGHREGGRIHLNTVRSGAHLFDCVLSGASVQATTQVFHDSGKQWQDYCTAVDRLEAGQNSAKIHFLLTDLPLTQAHRDHGFAFEGNTMLTPLPDTIAQLYSARTDHGMSLPLIYSTAVHSVMDDSFVSGDRHWFSVDLHYCPLNDSNGEPWTAATEHAIVEHFIRDYEVHCPEFRSLIEAVNVLTPQTLDARFHLQGGGCWHVAGVQGQHCEQRPVAGWDSYRTPIPGVYLCGAGTFPGGTVTGIPGHNCAQRVLADCRAASGSESRAMELPA